METSNVTISEPQTQEEFGAYFLLRYNVLRKPWNQPIGSEKDDKENEAIHAMAMDSAKTVVGVCRMQYNTTELAQLRYMAVLPEYQRGRIGYKLVAYLETIAKTNGIKKMQLHTRENAYPFYIKCGYKLVEKSYLLWGEIQHYLMEKQL